MFVTCFRIAILFAIIAMQLNTAFSSPLAFTKNVGQIKKSSGESSEDIQYVFNASGVNCYFFNNKLSYVFYNSNNLQEKNFTFLRYDVSFENSRQSTNLIPFNKLENEIQYLKGKTVQTIVNYEKLLYKEVYDKIDVEYLIKDGGLKYNIIIKPGGNPENFISKYEGKLNLTLISNNLNIKTEKNEITENIPEAYYINNKGEKVNVECQYKLGDGNRVSFELGKYDKTRELIIDPVVRWSTYIGSSRIELIGRADPSVVPFQTFDFNHTILGESFEPMTYQTGGITNDNDFKYIVGTSFTEPFPDFPLPGQTIENEWGQNILHDYDIFVAKYNNLGVLISSCVFGGYDDDFGMDIVVKDNYVHIVGTTKSPTFPLSIPELSGSGPKGGLDVVYIKLDKNLDLYAWDFLYSSRIGGSGDDIGHSITVDQNGNVAIVGETVSSDFPATGTCSSCYANAPDAFFLVINPVTEMVVYSAFFGGNGIDNALDVEFKKNSLLNQYFYYIVGATKSSLNFPLTAALQSYLNNDPTLTNTEHRDGFIRILDQNGYSPLFSSYYGGPLEDILTSIECYDYDEFVVIGGTKSVIYSTPFIRNSLNTDPYNFIQMGDPMFFPEPTDTNGNILIARFDITDPILPYRFIPSNSTIFGGTGMDIGNDIKILNNGHIVAVATVDKNDIQLKDSFQPHGYKGVYDNLDVYALRLMPDLRPVWASLFRSDYFASDDYDNRVSGVVTSNGDITFAGESMKDYIVKEDKDGHFASEFNWEDFTPMYQDVFVTTINEESRFPTYLGSVGSYNDFIEDIYSEPGFIYVTGKTQGRDLPIVVPNLQGSPVGNYDIFVTKYSAITGFPIWSMIYGGAGEDCGMKLTKNDGKIYLTGYTESSGLGNYSDDGIIPQYNFAGQRDVFVMKLTENLFSSTPDVNLDWFTYMGSTPVLNGYLSGGEGIMASYDPDLGHDVLFVCGYGCSDPIFKTNSTSVFGGSLRDGFIAKFHPNGTLLKSRWLGGNSHDACMDIAKTYYDTEKRRIGVVGYTGSTNFPHTTGTYLGGVTDQFFTELSFDLETVHYSQFIGSTGPDTAYAIEAEYFLHESKSLCSTKVYIGGNEYNSGYVQAYGSYFVGYPYTSGMSPQKHGKLVKSTNISYCYDITVADNTIFATGTCKGIVLGAEQLSGLVKLENLNNFNSFISSTPITSDPILSPTKHFSIGQPASNDLGRAIANCHNFFTFDIQFIAGINTNAYDVIELNNQNYPPFQSYNNGLYDGLLVKVDKDQAGAYKLFKEIIPEVELSLTPIVYPNPAIELINYCFDLQEDSFVEIEIVDIFGHSILKTQEQKSKGIFYMPLDIHNLQTGVYFIQTKINEKIYNNKFMKY